MLEFANGYLNDIDFATYFDDAFWGRFETMFSDESALPIITIALLMRSGSYFMAAAAYLSRESFLTGNLSPRKLPLISAGPSPPRTQLR